MLIFGAQQSAAQLTTNNGWVQLAPPDVSVNAAYMELKNEQLIAQTIVDINADCCAQAMLHKTKIANDMAAMAHVGQVIIPAQSSLQLAPGGLHIMLMEPQENLVEGDKVKLTFSFSNGTTQAVTLVVKKNEE